MSFTDRLFRSIRTHQCCQTGYDHTYTHTYILRNRLFLQTYTKNAHTYTYNSLGGARGVMVIVVGDGHEFKSWTRLIAFHIALIPLGKV